MPEETQVQEQIQQEEGGLGAGTQLGIAAFFLGLPFLGMGIEMLGWGEPALVLAAVGAGSLGLGTKLVIDRNRSNDQEPGDQEPGAHRGLPMPHLSALDRLQSANWKALLRPLDEIGGEQDETLSPTSNESQQPADNQQDYLNLGPTLRPHANTFLSGRKVLLGVSGSGKSNNLIVCCEELGRLEPPPPLILFDTDDENRQLCNPAYLPNPVWMDKSRRLTPGNAYKSAQTIMERRYQCIINLQCFEDEEAAWIMINMIKGVKDWEESRTVRIPCEIVLDEATVWLPQNPRESTLSSVMVEDPDGNADEYGKAKQVSLLSLVQRAFFSTVVRRGRKRGMGFTLAAQRIAEIDKRALQGSWTFLMRQTQAADFREYAKFGISPEEAMGLLDGEAFVFAPGNPREKHRLRESKCPHDGGSTPGLKELRSPAKREQVAKLAPESTPATDKLSMSQSATPAPVPVATPAPATVRFPDAEELPPSQPAPKNQSQEPRQYHTRTINPALQKAYDAYQPGMKHHSLASRLGVTPATAGQLLQQLHDHGYIDAWGNRVHEDENIVSMAPRKAALRAEDIDLQEAIRAWHEEGYNSEDKLMRRFPGLTKYQAGKLRDRIFSPKQQVNGQMNG